MNEKTKIYSLRYDFNPMAKKGDKFFFRDGYFVSEDESIAVKSTDNSSKIFKYESGR